MADERAEGANTDVHFVQKIQFEVAQGALIVALFSGPSVWRFALTLPFIFLTYERLGEFVRKPAKVIGVRNGDAREAH